MNKLLLVLVICATAQLSAQIAACQKLGSAEKFWAVTHPFVAKKAYRTSKHVLSVSDSLKQLNYFKSNTLSGSNADAVRHAYCIAVLSSEIGKRKL